MSVVESIPVHVNGLVPTAPPPPHREVWVEVGEEYPGHLFKLWRNFPQHLLADIQSTDAGRIRAALSRIVVAHNGWASEEGESYPLPTDPAFWDAIPTELAMLIMRAVGQEIRTLPNSGRASGGS